MIGRIGVSASAVLPLPVVTALDLSFLPALVGFVLVPLPRVRNRNSPPLAVLLGLWPTDLTAFHDKRIQRA